MITTIDDKHFHRILHALTDVELAVRQTARHDSSIGIHEVSERVAVLRLAINNAINSTLKNRT